MVNWNKTKFILTQKYQFLRKFLEWNSGYIHEPFKDSDRVFGNYGSIKSVLKENGDWRNNLPVEEKQSREFDTYGCVSFSLLNAGEILANVKFAEIWNKSDRFTVVMSGTGQYGNSMEGVYQSARKKDGLVKEQSWPWGENIITRAKYFDSIPVSVRAEGKEWLNEYELNIEYVPQNLKLMREALKYSPLWVSGYAWYQEGGYYKSYGRANHCFCIVHIDSNGVFYALDHYAPFIKKLSPDYLFGDIRLVLLDKRPTGKELEIKKLIDRGFKYIMRVQGHGEIYELVNQQEIKYIDPVEWNNLAVKDAVNNKKLVPIPEDLYNRIS